MRCEVEISSFDLRYEDCRIRNLLSEDRLRNSILLNGIRDSLCGVSPADGQNILLDGFKRLRCAQVLGINIVPYAALDVNEAEGIVGLLRLSIAKGLSILEQASLIDRLKSEQKLSTMEIAEKLEKSPSWVSMRSGIISEMSGVVKEKVFKGQFPAYSYMYTLRHFMRMNGVKRTEIDRFVIAISGKKLSTREIERLAYGYFKGPQEFRHQIDSGNIEWSLRELSSFPQNQDSCSEFERTMIRDLEITGKYMERVTYKSVDPRLKTGEFFAQANLLVGGILNRLENFSDAMEVFHDRSGDTKGCHRPIRQRRINKTDQPST